MTVWQRRDPERETKWYDRAACYGACDPEEFYPYALTHAGKPVANVLATLAVCNACPVQAECLEDALATGDFWGIRGGRTPDELRAIAKRRARGRASRAGMAAIDHGTDRGWWQHKNAREEMCAACEAAHEKARVDRLRELLVTNCGSRRGYENHRALGEQPCDGCTEAVAVDSREQRAKRKKASA